MYHFPIWHLSFIINWRCLKLSFFHTKISTQSVLSGVCILLFVYMSFISLGINKHPSINKLKRSDWCIPRYYLIVGNQGRYVGQVFLPSSSFPWGMKRDLSLFNHLLWMTFIPNISEKRGWMSPLFSFSSCRCILLLLIDSY